MFLFFNIKIKNFKSEMLSAKTFIQVTKFNFYKYGNDLSLLNIEKQ